MRKIILLVALFFTLGAFSQNINDYQYVIVPSKFSIFKDNDRFRLNTTTKLLLEKYGFKVYMSTDTIPNTVGSNCERLYADLDQEKNMMTTKVKIVLKDCKEKIVYETEYGKSREKDFNTAYNQALRETSKSFDQLNYKYNGKNGNTTEVIAPVRSQETVTPQNNTPASTVSSGESPESFFFAQPTATGFQVVNSEPKVIMRLFKTSQKDVFIAEKGNSKGVVILKNGQWFFETYENSRLISEALKLKF